MSTVSVKITASGLEATRIERVRRARDIFAMGPINNESVSAVLGRADEFCAELQVEYRRCLHSHQISDRAKLLTHDVAEKLSNALDMAMWSIWEAEVAPKLAERKRKKASKRVYFPALSQDVDFRARMKELAIESNSDIWKFLRSEQPFLTGSTWLPTLKQIARQKHIKLIPQYHRKPDIRLTIPKGRSAVRFRRLQVFKNTVPEGVEYTIVVEGNALDPHTGKYTLPIDESAIDATLWNTFRLENVGVDAQEFLVEACQRARRLVLGLQSL